MLALRRSVNKRAPQVQSSGENLACLDPVSLRLLASF
jgi:hypothetical protein